MGNLTVNDNGVWKQSTPYVNDNGTWKEPNRIYVNDNGTWKEVYTKSKTNCLEWLNSGFTTDGIYKINPTGSNEFDVYCDMTTDGGGWTATTMLADSTTRNFFETTNTNKITDITNGVTTGKLSDMWVDENNKDILIRGWSSDTTRHFVYNQGMIIYDYLKSDINNLTKQSKQATTFTSSQKLLKNVRTGVTANSTTTYGSSGSTTSHYINATDGIITNYFLDIYVADGYYYRGSTDTAYPDGMADYHIGTQSTLLFDQNNYIVVFIR